MSGGAAGELVVRTDCVPTRAQVLALYEANEWSSAEKPDALMQALEGSDCVATAWLGDELVGLANALSTAGGHEFSDYSAPNFLDEASTQQLFANAKKVAERLLAANSRDKALRALVDGDGPPSKQAVEEAVHPRTILGLPSGDLVPSRVATRGAGCSPRRTWIPMERASTSASTGRSSSSNRSPGFREASRFLPTW